MPPGSRSIGATNSIPAPHGSSLSLVDHGVDRAQDRLDRFSISSRSLGEGRSHSPMDRVMVRDRGRPTPVRGRVVCVRDRLVCARGRIMGPTDLFPATHRPVSMGDRIEGMQRSSLGIAIGWPVDPSGEVRLPLRRDPIPPAHRRGDNDPRIGSYRSCDRRPPTMGSRSCGAVAGVLRTCDRVARAV